MQHEGSTRARRPSCHQHLGSKPCGGAPRQVEKLPAANFHPRRSKLRVAANEFYFAGLDVSVKQTSVCIVDDTGESEPEALLAVLSRAARHPASSLAGRHPGR